MKMHELDTIDPQDQGEEEGSFVKNQIHTMLRVLTHLEHAIGDEEDLPEWVQMKLSQAQQSVVGVMDYMISEKEREVERQTGGHSLMKEQGVAEGGKTSKQYWHPSSQSIKPKPASDVMYARHPDEDGIHYPDYGNTNKPPRKFRVKDNDGDTTTDSRYDRKGKLLHRISIDNESVNQGVAEMRDRRDSYQRDYDSSQTGFGRGHDHRGLGQELAHETNNIAIAINGKTWKVVPGKGYADSAEEWKYLRHMKDWAEKKSASSGKKWTVHLTGAEPTNEGIANTVMAKLPGFLNTIGKDSQSIAKIQDQINQRIAGAGAGNPAVAHLNDAHNLLSQMYKNPTEEQAKAFYQAVQKANGAGIKETATAGATSAANVGVGAVYKNKPPKQPKNKDGTAKNALDMKANLLTGGSVKR